MKRIIKGCINRAFSCYRHAKMIIAWLCIHTIQRDLIEKNFWLFQEKRNEARDNAYHLFRYTAEKHPDVNIAFVISKDTIDSQKVACLGRIIQPDSLKHYMYYLAAQMSISSQLYGATPYPAYLMYRYRKWARKDQKVVFLQHGITHNLLETFCYDKAKIDLFCCAAQREYAFIQQMFGYPENNVRLIGFCRYDKLINKSEKQVLIMPTWRSWLDVARKDKKANSEGKTSFLQSNYFKHYAALLENPSFQDAARRLGYQIVFYPHYSAQQYIDCFAPFANDVIIIADRHHYDVQELLVKSSLLVTDYSSVAFDFAYQGKPLVMYQFDEEQFRAHHYKKGYFDYRRDGFGPVYSKQDDVVPYVIERMEEGCVQQEIYKKKVNQFFTFRDRNNCQRTYDAIKSLR